MKNKLLIKKLVCSLIIFFFLIIAWFTVQSFAEINRAFFILLAILGLIFLILGAILTVLARKEKGALRVFLIITGISAICPFVFSILHNVFYALGIMLENWNRLFEILHGASFIIALLIAPLAFIVGAIGSVALLKHKK